MFQTRLIWPTCWTLVLAAVVLLGCSESLLHVAAVPSENQQAVYVRGRPHLQASEAASIEVGFVAYKDDQALVRVRVRNASQKSIAFGPGNIRVELKQGGEGLKPCVVLDFEQMLSDDGDSFAWDGVSVLAGIAGAVIPGGGWGKAAAQKAVQAGIAEQKRRDVLPKELTPEVIRENYLRVHTLAPGVEYQGVLRIDLADTPEPRDILSVSVALDEKSEEFAFRFEK